MPCPYGVIIFNNYLYSFGGYNWQQCLGCKLICK
ncbi:hypothetical protein ACYHQE_000724 [Aeromonas salmonicida]